MKPITPEDLTAYLARRLPDWRDIGVANLHRLPMGASRETFRFDLTYTDGEGPHTDQVILRRDPRRATSIATASMSTTPTRRSTGAASRCPK